MQKRWTSLIVSAVLFAMLTGVAGFVYFNDHAWGTWGDDSAGYIFLAGRLFSHQPIVYQDELATAGLKFFDTEKQARWLLPTHHEFINPDGTSASKYPLGASILYWLAAVLVHSSHGFYIVTPLLAAISIGLVYILAVLLWPNSRWRHLIGVFAGVMLATAELYYDYAIAQPMREIPSITFLLLAAIAQLLALRAVQAKRQWPAVAWCMVLGVSFGMAINVRETSALLWPLFMISAVGSLWEPGHSVRSLFKRLWIPIVAVSVSLLLALAPTIYDAVLISTHKVPFKTHDTSSVVILPNIDHLDSFSPDNLFAANGKFQPAAGGLKYYWNTLTKAISLPAWFVLIGIGLWSLWRRSRWTAVWLGSWMLSLFVIFSLWINPYSRYILPLLPIAMLLSAAGVVVLWTELLPRWFGQGRLNQAWMWVCRVLIIVIAIVSYQTPVTDMVHNIPKELHRFKAISQTDLTGLEQIGSTLKTQSPKPVLMFSGDWQYGTSETLEAHTAVKTIRFPLEQRFDFNPTQVNRFIDQVIPQHGYTLYVWADDSSSAKLFQWLTAHKATVVSTYQFTFQDNVQIWKVEGVK